MATIISSRAAASPITNQMLNLFKFSNLLNHFSTASSPGTQNPNSNGDGSSATKKPSRRKKKNLIEVAQFLPNWGIGYHMAKSHWTNVSYQITKINLYKDGRHGKAWGVVFKDVMLLDNVGRTGGIYSMGWDLQGLQAADAPKKISGVHKRCWRYIPSLTISILDSPNPAEMAPKAEVQAA